MPGFDKTAGIVELKLLLTQMGVPNLNDTQMLAIVNKFISMIPPPKSFADIIVTLITNNGGDILDLINKLGGIGKVFEIMPDLMKISKSLES